MWWLKGSMRENSNLPPSFCNWVNVVVLHLYSLSHPKSFALSAIPLISNLLLYFSRFL